MTPIKRRIGGEVILAELKGVSIITQIVTQNPTAMFVIVAMDA